MRAIQNELGALRRRSDLGELPDRAQHLILFRRSAEEARLLESGPLIPLLRFDGDDEYLTRLCAQLMDEVRWPTEERPAVAAFATQGFMTYPRYDLIVLPLLEHRALLGLPDLFHELGHLFFSGVVLAPLLGLVEEQERRALAALAESSRESQSTSVSRPTEEQLARVFMRWQRRWC